MAETSAYEMIAEGLEEASVWLHTMSDEDFAKVIRAARYNLIASEARARGMSAATVNGVRVHAPSQEQSNG